VFEPNGAKLNGKKPLKLIIQIPCFNEEETLPAVLASLPRSIPGVATIEILVIDDGSTDDSLNIARDAAKGDPRVRLIASQNQGHPASLNAAAKM